MDEIRQIDLVPRLSQVVYKSLSQAVGVVIPAIVMIAGALNGDCPVLAQMVPPFLEVV